MTSTLRPVRRWADQGPGFNRPAAETVFKAMMSLDDDGALVFGRMLVGESVRQELIGKRAELVAAIDAEVEHRVETLRKRLSREAIAKARSGADSSAQLHALATLIKAFDFTPEQRREYARQQQRDLRTGRFAVDHARIHYDPDQKARGGKHEKQLGIEPAAHLEGKDRAAFQQAYAQVADLLAPYRKLAGKAGDSVLLHLHIDKPDGSTTTVTREVPAKGHLGINQHVGEGDRVRAASVSVAPPVGAGGAYYDTLAGVGAPRAGAALGGATEGGALDPDRLKDFRGKLEENYNQDEFIPSQRVFRHLEHGSRLLSDSLGDAAPRKVQYALAVGEHVGQLGPEAQKVIGPTADRAAYRYRGTERPVQPALANSLEDIRRNPAIPGNAKRWFVLHGNARPDGSVPAGGWAPSGVLSYFRRRLPRVDLNTLQLKSGQVPPSQGVILDKHGRAVHESVGYGDDWYLPFNLKNLKALKGGEYIRTRTYGGPTTEDIYTGLMSGARGLTVVSHNGVYTVDFANDLRGGRRFNDKAARMVGRYGHLLDAVRSRQVTTGGIDSSRMSELQDKAERLSGQGPGDDGYESELKRLKTKERAKPQLSQAQRAQATLDFFNDYAASTGATDRQVTNPDELVDAYVNQVANRRYAAEGKAFRENAKRYPEFYAGKTPPSLEHFRTQAHDALADDDPVKAGQNVADALGIRSGLDQAMKKAEQTNARGLSPLQLNGEGYELALNALQEQFPYYIDRVAFHPWTDAKVGAGQHDTGYVLPRHNRPAEALSGYFDKLVGRGEEKGKFYADSTRWQNRNQTPRPYRAEAGGRKEGGEEGAAGKQRALAPEQLRQLRDDADLKLAQALRGATHFGPAVVGGGGIADPTQVANRAIAPFLQDEQFAKVAPNLSRLLRMTPAEFDDARARGELHEAVGRAHQENKARKLIHVEPGVVADFENEGRPAARRQLSDPSAALDAPDAEYEFPNSAYSESAEPSTERIAEVYHDEPSISALVSAGKLPGHPGDDSFKPKADALLDELRGKKAALLADLRAGRVPKQGERDAIDRPAEGLIRARQLHRRHVSAAKREAPEPEKPPQDVHERVVIMSPEQMREWGLDDEGIRNRLAGSQ